MSTIDLKERLIDKIQTIDDNYILEEASRLLGLTQDQEDIYKLNAEQKAAIVEARAQIARGEYLTDDEVRKEMDEWLKK